MSNHDIIDENIASALEKLMQVQRLLLWDITKKEKLSPIQIQFLIYLGKYPAEYRKVSQMAREFDLTKATVSDALNSLEDKGYVKKIREADDKRSHVISLTRKGIQAEKRIHGWQDVLVSHIQKFPMERKEQFITVLLELIQSLYREGVISVARMCITCENFAPGENGTHHCLLTDRYLKDSELSIGCAHHRNREAV
ncbi:MAG: MarR family winged helix-turn-helix transcriptional regulator [Spirochaetota bacterium]